MHRHGHHSVPHAPGESHAHGGPHEGPIGQRAPRPRRRRGWLAQLAGWAAAVRARRSAAPGNGGAPLPLALRRGRVARAYLSAARERDHRRAAAAAVAELDRAVEIGQWEAADVWGHQALWHFERAGMELHATRAARRIADVRLLSGDPAGSRRYYAEAISEARDLGAEREEGLAALGLGRAHLELRKVADARRLAQIAVDLLERCGAPEREIAAARELRGLEKRVTVEGMRE